VTKLGGGPLLNMKGLLGMKEVSLGREEIPNLVKAGGGDKMRGDMNKGLRSYSGVDSQDVKKWESRVHSHDDSP